MEEPQKEELVAITLRRPNGNFWTINGDEARDWLLKNWGPELGQK